MCDTILCLGNALNGLGDIDARVNMANDQLSSACDHFEAATAMARVVSARCKDGINHIEFARGHLSIVKAITDDILTCLAPVLEKAKQNA